MIKKLLSQISRREVIKVMAPYTVGAWLIMQVAAVMVPALGLPGWVTSLVVVAGLVGFPIAAYVAWFFDITADGLKRKSGLDEEEPEPLTKRHWLGLGVASLGALGIGVLAFDAIGNNAGKGAQQAPLASTQKSIAVLPFTDLSSDRDQKFLSEGLAEELIIALGKLKGLKVAASHSSFALQGPAMSNQEKASLLGVETLLTGSVLRDEARLSVTTSLIDASSGKILWTEKFARSFDDIFEVEEEISRAILITLLDRYIEKDGTPIVGRAASADAYVFYLKGQEAIRRRTTESIAEARKLYEKAISSDPEYAPAYVGFANATYLLSSGEKFYGDLDPQIAAVLATEIVQKALVRDPELAQAYGTLGLIQSQTDHHAALASFDKALEINESYADVWVWRYLSLLALSRIPEALIDLQKAGDLDPLSQSTLYNQGWEMAKRGKTAEARAYFQKMIGLDSTSPLPYRGLADVSFRDGDMAQSAQYYRKASDLSEDNSQFQLEVLGIFIALNLIEPARAHLAKDYKANVLIADQKFQELFELMSFETAAHPDDPYIMMEAGLYEQFYGESTKARPLLQKAMDLLPVQEQFYMPYCSPAVEYAFALLEDGREDKAMPLLERCTTLHEAESSGEYVNAILDYLGARLAAMSGDEELAAARLQAAYQHGWREYWTRDDLLLKSLSGNPAYEEILSRIDADLANQRQVLAEVSKTWFDDL